MPHSTFRYPFEWKVFQATNKIFQSAHRSLTDVHSNLNSRESDSFLILFDQFGAAQSIRYQSSAEQRLTRLCEQFSQDGHSFFLYDPFDLPEWVWVGWNHIEKSTMEHLIGLRFVESDFVPRFTRPSQTREPMDFPHTWGVMF